MSLQLHLNKDQEKVLHKIWDIDYPNLLNRIDEKGIPYLKHVFDLYFKIYGEVCSNCPSKISGYIQKLKSLKNITMQNENIKESQFELHDDVMIPVPGTSDAYSQHNMTDEIAIKLLSQNPNRKSLFRKLPENVDSLVEEYVNRIEVVDDLDQNLNQDQNLDQEQNIDPELVTIGVSKVTIEEAHSLLELINVKTRASTAKGIENKISELAPEDKAELEKLVNDFVAKK